MNATSHTSPGFTLIEMLVVLAVTIALLVVAVPGFQEIMRNNRMLSEVYSLRATLNNARSAALSRRAAVVVCPTVDGAACSTDTNNWRLGYMAFVDDDNNSVRNSGEEQIQVNVRDGMVDILFDNANRRIRFDAQGGAMGSQGTFEFCDPRGATGASAMILNPAGSVRAARDTDTPVDDIVNDLDDANVAC